MCCAFCTPALACPHVGRRRCAPLLALPADAALQHIAAICGPRYNPNKGLLQLSSDRYPHREANRAHIRQVLDALVAEGHAKFPAQQQAAAAAP